MSDNEQPMSVDADESSNSSNSSDDDEQEKVEIVNKRSNIMQSFNADFIGPNFES